jgi:lipopolysaccharide biosynthesis protein
VRNLRIVIQLLNARVIAYYLPQFHPIPENDQWWGKGFTEWTNVTRARPLFRGHHQPHLPADLGFYDLRVPEVREQQAMLARQAGIEGFCYWHYWFNGKRLLDRPINEVLANGRPDFPFCVGWANESWTRRWTGEEAEVLLKQTYSPDDDLAHARWLAEVFSDTRYLRVDGRPIFVLYRAPSLPDPKRTTDTFRSECVRLGVSEPFIIGRDTHNRGMDMRALGCDISESSSPALGALPRAFHPPGRPADWTRNARLGVWSGDLKIYDYEDACRRMERIRPSHPHIPGFFVGWDNTPRRGRKAIVLTGATPDAFARGFRVVIDSVQDRPPERRIIFVNAWNEWAEGMYLEPGQLYGHGFLDALRAELTRAVVPSTAHYG